MAATEAQLQPASSGGAGTQPGARTDRSVLVVYGSETGNAQDIAEDLGRSVERLRFRTSVEELDDVELKELVHYQLVVLVMPTTGQGDMPGNATKFWKSLLRRKLPPSCLSRLKFTSFGLGDSSYPKFNWAVRKLNKRLSQLGAREFFASGEGDERHDNGIDTIYLPWSQALRSHLLTHYPIPSSLQPIPDSEALPPRYTLAVDASPGEKIARPGGKAEAGTESATQKHNARDLVATVQSNVRVTPADHWQDVRLLTFDVERPKEESWSPPLPGATIVIYPENSPADVTSLIERMHWQNVADLPARILLAPASHPRPLPLPKGLLYQPGFTLRDLLTHSLDIAAVPKRSFLEKLSFMTAGENEKERLRELVDPGGSQDFYDYTSRPRRTILEILGDFPLVKIPHSAVLDLFPVIRGREFSMADCYDNKNNNKDDDGSGSGSGKRGQTEEAISSSSSSSSSIRVEILAALVEYRTIIRKPRVGLCSGYLKTLQGGVGTRINVTIKPGCPLAQKDGDHARPIIAVATGTGIAPIRMLHHARLRKAPPAPGEMLLFFGCRNRVADYYFADEWRRAASSSLSSSSDHLTVIPAFSRDQDAVPEAEAEKEIQETTRPPPEDDPTSTTAVILRKDQGKNYVQHHIRRHAKQVADLISKQGSLVCICGSAGNMPKAVRLALEDALVAGGVCADAAGAEEYLATKVDVWQETW